MSYSSPASYRGNPGTLELENGMLKFITRSGLVSRRDYVVQSIPLRAIRSMNTQGVNKVFGMVQRPLLVVVVDTSEMPGIPRHEFHLDAPDQWIAAIQNEMKVRDAESAKTVQPTYVKEVVREIVKYPCPYCSVLIEVTQSRCPSCGAPQKK
ncbi:MAG: hypothetical protein E4H14_15150 [Candidatus Thorarchaeota archaeon]|nr:MAG: hypothetical protein E4H14_15150 [Candidatus Thorarchaeota archaeon]